MLLEFKYFFSCEVTLKKNLPPKSVLEKRSLLLNLEHDTPFKIFDAIIGHKI